MIQSGVINLEGIKAKTFAFGDPASTPTARLFPELILIENALTKGEDPEGISLVAHDVVAFAVQNGSAKASARMLPRRFSAGSTGANFMGLQGPAWMPTGRWFWTISCRAGSKRDQRPGSCTRPSLR